MRTRYRVLAGFVVILLLGLAGYVLQPGRDTFGKVEFDRPLAIPPLAASTVDAHGRRVFDLTAGRGVSDFGRGRTPTSGYNGAYLGPTLRATRGERVTIKLHNELGEDTTMHWHGMVLPAQADGGPGRPIRAGATAAIRWRVDQRAATLWYHPHLDGHTQEQVYQGLAGMFLVDDPATDVAALPHTYGVDDIPVMVQDKLFRSDGRLDGQPPAGSDVGVLGDTVLVNGTPGAYQEVTTGVVRLRLLNASSGRSYRFGFSDDRPFSLIGTDGGLLAAPHRMNRLDLSVGERADVLVPMRPGERVTLRSYPYGGGNLLIKRFQGGGDSLDILQLRAAAHLSPGAPIPATLVHLPAPDASKAVAERTFDFHRYSINGRRMDMNRVDAVVTARTSEVWTVHNSHVMPHSFHLHGEQFRVLSVDGAPAPPELSGWKDTLALPPGERFRLLVSFSGNADPSTPYMFHCHVLRHEDKGMMGQLLVVEPGQQPDLISHRHEE